MSRKINNLLAAMIPLALYANDFGHATNNSNNLKPSDINVTPKEKLIPKGCKRYYFNSQGMCCKSESEVFFDALKPSTARKKFEKWLLNRKSVV